jgi:hypothetical protein
MFCEVQQSVEGSNGFSSANMAHYEITGVLQVLYQCGKKDLPIYPGQIFDILIESIPIGDLLKK